MKELVDKLGQEQAFPFNEKDLSGNHFDSHLGISKRFYAACFAMQGILANSNLSYMGTQTVIKEAYLTADELLKQENEY